MSDFNYAPVNGPTAAQTPKVDIASFGDGYEQRSAHGINHMPETHNLTFRGAKATIYAIRDFFREKGGLTTFTWTPEDEDEIKVKCTSWTMVRLSKQNAEISATFEQVFE